MRMRRFALIALLSSTVLVAPAQAVTKMDEVRATVKRSGTQGTAMIYKGTVNSKVFGKGTVVEKVYSNLKGTFVITYKKGKVKGTSTAKLNDVSGSTIKVSGTYRITGGTGAYKKVRGSGKFTGTSSQNLQKATFHQRGKVSY